MTKPWEPPEKRPSVISAHWSPRPAPMIAEVGVSISGIPGPPLGPSYRMTTTEFLNGSMSLETAASMSSSQSKQRALPWNLSPSLPVILATEPSGERLPYRICRCPEDLMGLSSGRMMSWPAASGGHTSRFSARVLPVTVMHEPSINPCSMRYLSTAGVPPTLCKSSMTYLPLGFRSAMNGTLSLIRWKSSKVTSTPHAFAMAIKCNTAFVLPPVAITNTIAFSKLALVIMSLGLMSPFISSSRYLPANRHSTFFRGSSAGVELEYGRLIPIASIADAIVLAVYIPPHAPGPGQEFFTISARSFSSMSPAANPPYDWNAETISNFSPLLDVPARIVPP
mmetsp:Transcript_108/g.281  ORF Transcript_108/g.281 Transcript_108/m.281 type:complete len:338 (-) Transcript_108:568-1581(-)